MWVLPHCTHHFSFAAPSFCSHTFCGPFPGAVISATSSSCCFVVAAPLLARSGFQHLRPSHVPAALSSPACSAGKAVKGSSFLLRDHELSSYQGGAHFSHRVPVITRSVNEGGILQLFYIRALIYFARAFLRRKFCISLTHKTSLFLSPSIRNV